MKEQLMEAIQSIHMVTECFYQNKNTEGYQQLENSLIIIDRTVNHIFQCEQEGHHIEIDQSELTNILTRAMDALEQGDVLLFSDIFEYDLTEIFEQAMENLAE